MEKRFQIFISSTFRDLVEERQEVLKAVLELNHMPAGMELFPAEDDTAWQLIKDVIDASDYYVLIIGGRYGSLDETGLGYTEKEYEYAHSQKKPIIPLLHGSPEEIPRGKTETDAATWEKLKTFREKVEKWHTCQYWKNAEQLKSKVITSLVSNIKRHPAVGWIRASEVPSQADLADILALRQRVSELEGQLTSRTTEAPSGTEGLQQGNDTFEFEFSYTIHPPDAPSYQHGRDKSFGYGAMTTWDSVFASVAPRLIQEASEDLLRKGIRGFLHDVAWSATTEDVKRDKKVATWTLESVDIDSDVITTCIVQFRALNLITESVRKRSIHDKGTYWILTPYGDSHMVRLRALRRDTNVESNRK